MGWFGWIWVGILGANVLFFGTLFAASAIRDRRERNEHGKAGSAAHR